jgi:hypothetical protein
MNGLDVGHDCGDKAVPPAPAGLGKQTADELECVAVWRTESDP